MPWFESQWLLKHHLPHIYRIWKFWHFPILTLSDSDSFQFWHFQILTLSDFFQNGQKLDYDTFQFWHFPIPPAEGYCWRGHWGLENSGYKAAQIDRLDYNEEKKEGKKSRFPFFQDRGGFSCILKMIVRRLSVTQAFDSWKIRIPDQTSNFKVRRVIFLNYIGCSSFDGLRVFGWKCLVRYNASCAGHFLVSGMVSKQQCM